MSTNYIVDTRTKEGIPWKEVLKLSFADLGNKENTPDTVALTIGVNTLWAYKIPGEGKSKKSLANFTAYGSNNPDEILETLGNKFECEFLSEHDEDFRYVVGPDWSANHHRHGVDFEVALFDEGDGVMTAEWRVDGQLVETEVLKKIARE